MAELDVIAGDIVDRLVMARLDLALDGMNVANSGEVEVLAPHEGRQHLEESFTCVNVAGHRPRLDHRGALPILAKAAIIVFRHDDGDRRGLSTPDRGAA